MNTRRLDVAAGDTAARGSGRPPGTRGRLSDHVAERIRALIVEQVLEPGDRLPPERELCKTLGVSRTVVREAVRSLAAVGLLEVRQGDGTLVRTPDLRTASDAIGIVVRAAGPVPFRLAHEVRRLLEVEIAGLAARRRTEDDLALIEARLAATAETAAGDPEAWVQADLALHAAIATAAHNPVFPVLLGVLSDMLLEVRHTASGLPGVRVRAQPFHEAIVAAIAARDATAARRAMTEHMKEAESTYRRARAALLAAQTSDHSSATEPAAS